MYHLLMPLMNLSRHQPKEPDYTMNRSAVSCAFNMGESQDQVNAKAVNTINQGGFYGGKSQEDVG